MASATGPLPDLVVIGAMKCATTALHRYLDAHPEIGMAAPKEMNFFIGPERAANGRTPTWCEGNWHRGLAWYSRHFPDAPVRGEASPGYTSPSFPHAAERIARVLPRARLVYLVRDPIDRALSQYAHHAAEGAERRPVAEALLDERSQYLDRSRYLARLEPFLQHFAPERIAVVLQEDLLRRRRETLGALYRFAGVDDGFWSAALEQRHHVRTAGRGALDRRLERALAARLAPDVERLRAFIGRDLAEWRSY